MGQEPGAAVPPPPPAMSEMKPNQGSGGVMVLIQDIIEEAHEMEVDALKAESDSQAGYEEFIKNSNAAIVSASAATVPYQSRSRDFCRALLPARYYSATSVQHTSHG